MVSLWCSVFWLFVVDPFAKLPWEAANLSSRWLAAGPWLPTIDGARSDNDLNFCQKIDEALVSSENRLGALGFLSMDQHGNK
jgi:hypothetical protein